MTINQSIKPGRGRRNAAATLLVAAGAIALSGLGATAAAPANAAADSYIALSYSLESKVPGTAVAATSEAARIASLQKCQDSGGNHCVTYVIALNGCAALAIGTDPTLHQEWSEAKSSDLVLARKQALTKNGGGVIGAAGCTTSLQDISPPQAPPLDASPPADPPPAQPTPPPLAPVEPPVPHDKDGDGLSKQDELFTHHTNPFLSDTDFDGTNDGDEVRNGTNPLNPLSN